ncbi:MAG: putative phosphothreonine lyase domain-containing protein [Anaerolineae bacterium]
MTNQGDKLDMDLINRVQNARMMHDESAMPSKVPGVYWIEAKHPNPPHPPTARSGEFRISTTVDQVDAEWARIKQATEKGTLGYKSKVSTSATDGIPHSDQRVICVRTYDANDAEDRARIAQSLEQMGFDASTYQRDQAQ